MNTACLHCPAGHPFHEREDRMKLKIIAYASALLLTSSLTAQASPLCAGNNACSPTDNSVTQSTTNSNTNAPVAFGGAGGQGVGFGLSFGTTWENEDCKLRKGAGLLYATGNTKAAKEMLCANETYRAAFLAAKEPCAADASAPVAAMGPQTPEIMGMSTPVPNP